MIEVKSGQPLNDDLLAEYMRSFYGYGNYRGDWWLVGMEEGGGDSVEDIRLRLRLWDERGRRELEDVDIFSASPAHGKWFTAKPPLQRTWAPLIRMMLAAEGRPANPDLVRAYQGGQLGRVDSNNCILELLPLPSRSVGDWIYGEHSRLPELSDRETYRSTVVAGRVEHLRRRIAEHKPKGVIFYSRSYREYWEQVAGEKFSTTEVPELEMVATSSTVFVMTRHPTHHGVTNEYFARAGAVVSATLSSVGR